MAMPVLTRITIYPIKSLDGIDLLACEVLPSGALRHDRRYALVDSLGQYINGKQYPQTHRIRATYSGDCRRVSVSFESHLAEFSLESDLKKLANWCSKVIGKTCRIVENEERGLPDDHESPGPTLISTASLEAVATWFQLPLEETRRRFRANLEISAAGAFWEDRLVGQRTRIRRFAVGGVIFQGRSVCQRCAVPTRDTQTGTVIAGFARRFADERERSLPAWSYLPGFDHFYRLAVNTGLDSARGESIIRVGDALQLV